MEQRIKLIWEFRGPNAQRTAEHHIIHLNEYIEAEAIENSFSTVEKQSENLTMALLITPKRYMDALRKNLKPHRGQLYTEV